MFARRDEFERFVSFLVYLPRERFHTDNRLKIQEILRGPSTGPARTSTCGSPSRCSCGCTSSSRRSRATSPRSTSGRSRSGSPEATRSWTDDLRLALRGGPGGGGADDWRRYADAFPVVYRADNPVDQAVRDIRSIDDLYRTGGLDCPASTGRPTACAAGC